jgi:thiamine pyrophosphate-dependent acetolactate synthase large subunit-like protein
LLGTANFKISHGLVEAGVELISARHEGNAASMADAYAKATGELTLVSVHSGPGLTNAITGIGEAAKSRTPLLVLAGDVPTGNVKSISISNRPSSFARSVRCPSARTRPNRREAICCAR